MKLSSLKQFLGVAPRIPGEVLVALVDSLYAPVISLTLASASTILLGFVTAARANEPLLADCGILLAVVTVARLSLVVAYRHYNPASQGDVETLKRWEMAYAVGAYAFAASIGALDATALLMTNDAVVHMLVLMLTTGCMAGAVIRNSSVRYIALGQIVLSAAPVCYAAAARNEFDYDVVGLIYFMFALSAVEICLYQSANTLRVLLARREKSELAQLLEEQNKRFDAALNNMPQGLCMFDGEGRLVVANARVGQLYGLPDLTLTRGELIEEIAAQAVRLGGMSEESAAQATSELRSNLLTGQAVCTLIPLPNGRMLSSTQAPLPDGGAVVLYEDVTERQQAEARVRYLATHDVLTGLPNRTLFTQLLREEIDACAKTQRTFCVLFIDLDRFKAINDTLGHAAGDFMLREISTRLKNCLRAVDIAARFAGDEFVAIVRDVDTPQEATKIAENVMAQVNAPMRISGQECSVTASIGAAIYPADGEDEDTLLKNADAAMYLAKAEGKSGVRLYSPKVKTQTLQGLMLETSMRHALARNEFLVVYQPKRDLANGAITGVEALLRWRHPELGMLSPDRFIPIAEETGMIVPIGKWVLETACAQQMAWRAQGMEPISIAVNLSPRQLYADHIIGDISGALEKSGMEPHWLELEITESMVMQDARDATLVLRAINYMGVKLAIDDFGTGYSSLSLVKALPLDAIKIDRTFINDLLTDPNDRAIAEAVISLGKALKLRVIAEGVETEAQETFLRERGCMEMQGYLFSRPLEADALLSFAADYNLSRLRLLGEREAIKKSA